MSLRPKLAATIFLFALSSIPPAFSQGFGTLVGAVTDPSGGVVANAKVTAVESETDVARGAVSDTAGIYTIPGLRPTTYRLTVEAPGLDPAGAWFRVRIALAAGRITRDHADVNVMLLERDEAAHWGPT